MTTLSKFGYTISVGRSCFSVCTVSGAWLYSGDRSQVVAWLMMRSVPRGAIKF